MVWREAGSLHNKQNVFDDFIASAEYLIDAGYTTPAKLVTQVSWSMQYFKIKCKAVAYALHQMHHSACLLPHS